jgi:hypothetical protein
VDRHRSHVVGVVALASQFASLWKPRVQVDPDYAAESVCLGWRGQKSFQHPVQPFGYLTLVSQFQPPPKKQVRGLLLGAVAMFVSFFPGLFGFLAGIGGNQPE